MSHEQNTDTGTTSKTFVIDSGNTGAMLKAEGGGLSTRTKGDAGYANFTVQNLVIKGDVTQEGDTFITQAERVEVRDNMILINEGETGAGVTAGFAGIEVDRGTEQNFMFGFNESDGMFKIGKEGDMFDVALRQPAGNMIDGMFASWDAATKTFKTTNVIPYNKSLDFKFDPEIVDATLKMKFMEAGLALSMSGDDSILALFPGIPQDEVKYSLISTNTNGIILGDSSGSNDKFILDIKKPSFISPVLDKNVIIGGKNAYFSYYSHRMGSPNTITASCGVKAPSFYRESDKAEVLYSLDQARLTDGMFLSWDDTNKMVVTTNIVPKGQSVFFGNENSFITYGSTSLNSGSGSAIGFNLNMQFGNLLIYPSSVSGYLVFDGGLRGQGYGNGIKFNSPINVEKVNSTGKFLELSVGDTTSIKMEGSGVTIATQVVSPSYHRSSDDSEVLYQADLKSVLTGKETNYAPTVKAVSDAIDSVNTGTTESLKGYLKLSGGTMTGSIISNVNQILKYNYNSASHSIISFVIDGPGYMSVGNYTSGMRVFLLTNDSDVLHYRSTDKLTGTSYRMWDTYNLPTPASTSDIPDVSDMAKKSEANTFTAQNTFTAGQFNVGPFEVSSTGQLLVNITTSDRWERSITFKANSDNATSIRIGGHGIGSTSNFAWIGVGDVEYDTAQYRFYGTSMKVPSVWSLDDADGNSLIWTQSTQLAHIGRATGTTKIRSGAVDLIHTKGATDYKILDESNYSQYLPTNNKWTYGFVNTYIEGSNADFNTLFAGPDSPKILFNYYRPIGDNTNAPTGMSYGAVLQIDGNYNSAYNNVVLRPQLAFDINHNVENGTRYMWFRIANNLGYGDSSNWKRVVTADENVAVLVMDANTYPSIARIDGTTYNWLRTPAQGLLPNTQATLDSGGTSYLGTNDWSFGYASIHTIYSKRYMFGNTGVDFRLDTNNKIAATISGSARGIEIGDLLVSSNYGEDAAKVPTNGIFASGIIKSYSGFSSDSRINNLNISKTSNDALLISSFAGEKVINKPGVDPVSGQAVDDGVALTYFWAGDYAFQLVGDIDGSGMAYRKYTPSTGDSTDWKFLADTKWVNTKLGGYLPLTGGILSGQLIINSISNSLILNNTNSSETESFIKVQLNGTSKAAIGFLSSIGSYIYNYESDKYLFVGTDGAYLGNTISKAKLLTSADLSGYATQTWANSKFAPLSTFKILSGYPAIVNVGNEFILTSNQSGIYVNYRTPSDTIIPTTWYWKDGTSTGYANGYWGKLYMVEKLVATQEWVSDRGYLTSITKSMVTSALGYTPPTTNTTYSQATSSTLGLVKIGATGLAAKNYAVQLNSSGQMYVAVPWTDTNSTYSAATSSTYGLVKIGATGLAAKNYAVQLNSSGQMYVSVPWTDTDTNTHYTTRLYAGASGTAANAAASNPYLKVTDDNTYRNQVRFIGAGATSISSDASGNITITSTNTTYGLASSSSNGLMSSSQYTKLSNCIETVSAANMVTSVQVVDTIPEESSQVTGRLYLKFA